MARPRSKTARKKMLAAATSIVAAKGVKDLTIEEVARISGVAKTTIYRHFASKNELLLAAVDGTVSYPVAPDSGTLRGDLTELLEAVLPSFADTTARCVFLDMFSAAARDPELESLRKVFDGGKDSPIAVIHRGWQEKG
jgi:AcrR family transcriptional regulator